jgi:hypothetical protein
MIAAYHPEREVVHPIPHGRAKFRNGQQWFANLTPKRL